MEGGREGGRVGDSGCGFVVLVIARVAFIPFISGFALGIYGFMDRWRYMEWLKEGREGGLVLGRYQNVSFFSFLIALVL